MSKKPVTADGITRLHRVMFMAVIPLILVILLALVSCAGTAAGDSIILEFAPGHNPTDGIDAAGFDAEGSVVLRCASIEQNENGILVSTSKSMNMKADTLLFVKHIETDSSEASIQIASAPISGKEYEYDMTQARFYTITTSSALRAIENYGIPFVDWQTGVCSSSERFPCCE